MDIKEQVDINATPGQVWPFIVDPVIQAAWNPMIVSINRPQDGPVAVGEIFTMVAAISGTERTSEVRVAEASPGERLVFEHHTDGNGEQLVITETYTLQATGGGTRVNHTIDLRQLTIPLVLRPLIWLAARLGKRMSDPKLQRLRQMIEADLGLSA